MDYQEAIENIDCILEHFEEFKRDGVPIAYEGEEKILEEAKNVMQEFYKQQEIISKNPDYLKAVKWMQNIIDDAQVCLDKMEQEAKQNPNIHCSPLLYEGRKRKAGIIISCLKKLTTYEQLGTLEEVRDAVERQQAKKPLLGGNTDKLAGDIRICPYCSGVVGIDDIRADFCADCGQHIDWE